MDRVSEVSLRYSDLALRLDQPVPEYIAVSFEIRDDRYDREKNPNGYISLAISEDKNSAELVAHKLHEIEVQSPIAGEDLGYDFSAGTNQMRKAVSYHLQKHLFGLDSCDDALVENVCVAAGAGSCIDALVSSILNPNDGVLLPVPNYKGFEMDCARSGARLLYVPTFIESNFVPSHEDIQETISLAHSKRIQPRILLLSSPQNPTGRVFTTREIQQIVNSARHFGLHTIFDEIYACSVFDENSKFTSCRTALGSLGDDVHLVYGLGKDFGACGLRLGAIYTENEFLKRVLPMVVFTGQASVQTQRAFSLLLSDSSWVPKYLEAHKEILRQQYLSACKHFDQAGIPYVESFSGFFMLIDLSKWCITQDKEGEYELWRILVKNAKVVLTPASDFFYQKPGFFRLIFSACSPEQLHTALTRISNCLVKME